MAVIAACADVNAQDREGKTVLMHAIRLKRDEIIRALIGAGAR